MVDRPKYTLRLLMFPEIEIYLTINRRGRGDHKLIFGEVNMSLKSLSPWRLIILV